MPLSFLMKNECAAAATATKNRLIFMVDYQAMNKSAAATAASAVIDCNDEYDKNFTMNEHR
ncbi:hypothetical protein DERF_008863 [Dermatophagoides farinae]|uniref:Uncharacterized protein n=1 Tax=Dermatophagoides farinae TaxID=6954 RepID=A0A922I355_DERFA|nr:hypothetical protein DERF_008863 [Dermatophagoides farinae]